MTVSQLTEAFLLNMGYSRADAAEPDVVEEYAVSFLRWVNEGYARAVRRLFGQAAAEALSPLRGGADEPEALPAALHALLADYAAARGQELRGNAQEASGLYASYERGLAEAARGRRGPFAAWREL
ncbi:MAG: hypothetical protein ACOX83_10075 [Candidatus Spyradocola sp.]